MSPRRSAKFAPRLIDVIAHRGLGDRKGGGDGRIGQTLRDQGKALSLTGGQSCLHRRRIHDELPTSRRAGMYFFAMSKKQTPKHSLVVCIIGLADSGLGAGLGGKATPGSVRYGLSHYL